MEIRKTKRTDIAEVLKIYADARVFMKENGNPHQWGDSFPSREQVESDIASEKSYVCTETGGRIAGVFYFAVEEEPSYHQIWEGNWLNAKPYGVIHRLASAASVSGAAAVCFAWCEAQCGNLRIDTHADNLPMQHILEKQGFARCGIIELSDGSKRIAYQKCRRLIKEKMKTVLTIAGSDCSGGAGIQADIKTITVHGLYAMSAVTALTAQNTTGVYGIEETRPEFLEQQLDCIFTDIFPDAVKIGMVSNVKLIEVIAKAIKKYQAKNIVLDPVMVSTSGSRLLKDEAQAALTGMLIPVADIITPNIPEAEVLSGLRITGIQSMEAAAKKLAAGYKGAILLKGGHGANTANDLLYIEGGYYWFHGEKINNSNTHGTGCTLSSAIACHLAMDCTIEEAAAKAKEYLTGAIRDNLDIGKGDGPLNHAYQIPIKIKNE